MKKMNKKTKHCQHFFSGQTWFYITKRTLSPEYANDIHWHDYYEMEFIVDGQGNNLIDGISYSMKKGSAFLLTPASFHVISGDKKHPLTLYHLEFDDSILEHAFPHSVISQFNEKETEELLLLFHMLEEEFFMNKKYGDELIKAILKQISYRLLRNTVTFSKETMEAPHIGKMINQIHYRFRSKITLRNLAEEANLNPNYLGELFTKTMGISFHQYVLDLRLKYAYALVLNSDLSINEICFESGFSTPSYFIGLFKKQFGITPSQLRNQLAEEKTIS